MYIYLWMFVCFEQGLIDRPTCGHYLHMSLIVMTFLPPSAGIRDVSHCAWHALFLLMLLMGLVSVDPMFHLSEGQALSRVLENKMDLNPSP